MAARRQTKELGAGWVRSFADDRSSGQFFFLSFFQFCDVAQVAIIHKTI
jgi:hypothetical protein